MKHPEEPDKAPSVTAEASPPYSWWAYCDNADLEYWEGQFDTIGEAVAYARDMHTGEEFWVTLCEEDPDGLAENPVRLLCEPQRFAE